VIIGLNCAASGGAWELMRPAPFCSSGGAISASAQELLARLTAPAHYTAIDERATEPEREAASESQRD
jgi:hypothetical protein